MGGTISYVGLACQSINIPEQHKLFFAVCTKDLLLTKLLKS